MGQEIVYCGICGNRILRSEFEKGRAATLLKKNYCSKCSETLKQGQEPAAAREAVPSRTSARNIPARRIPVVGIREGQRRPFFSRMPFIAAVVIGVLAFLLILAVVMRSR